MIKLGVIGISDGNGHPFSWSAIFNGFDNKNMKNCGYPTISNYLNQQKWPESQIKDARVVSVWTQDYEISKRISNASFIPNIAKDFDDMMNEVDAVLLARDDFENHINFVRPFLKKGIPIYIDKPIAISEKDLTNIYSFEKYLGQIFTCSALRYSNELTKLNIDNNRIGKIMKIKGYTPKSWEKYAIHIVEPVLNMIDDKDEIIKCTKYKNKKTTQLELEWLSGIHTSFSTLGEIKSDLYLEIIGDRGSQKLVWKNTFQSFKAALQDFVDGIKYKECKSKKEYNYRVVNILERGL